MQVDPPVFSPDNDGYEDLLQIRLSTGTSGWIFTVWITDLAGNCLRSLANNHLGGPLSIYTWDGADVEGSMAPVDLYVVHVRAFHPPSGEGWVRRRAVGLVYR